MRHVKIGIAAIAILALVGLRPLVSSGALPAHKQSPGKERVIYAFHGGLDGEWPMAGLTLDAAGNLYGTTFYGGGGSRSCGCGIVFELKRSGNEWHQRTLHEFNSDDGGYPAASMIFDNLGNLYGTTSGGFDTGLCGNVFKLTPNSNGGWTESVLYTFTCGKDGYSPRTDLVFDNHGNLFGTTAYGGASYGGTVFELVPQANGSWKEIILHSFAGGLDGEIPASPVVLDSSGNVWGTTTSGGAGKCEIYKSIPGCGVVYKLSPTSDEKWTETVVYDFVRGGGKAVTPSGWMILDSADHLLMTTTAGGDGLGTFVELRPSQKGWEQQVLYRFIGDPDGERPVGALSMGADGTFFGATPLGGRNGPGTVFELSRSKKGWKEKVVYSFKGNVDGTEPQAGPVSDSHGRLYGTTVYGGGSGCTYGCGTVYEITP